MGMMLGGGVGRELAEWVATGAPQLDMFSMDPARFHPDCVADGRWVRDATHESYAKTYSIVFPHDEALASRGARRSALHGALAARGCVHQARHSTAVADLSIYIYIRMTSRRASSPRPPNS